MPGRKALLKSDIEYEVVLVDATGKCHDLRLFKESSQIDIETEENDSILDLILYLESIVGSWIIEVMQEVESIISHWTIENSLHWVLDVSFNLALKLIANS